MDETYGTYGDEERFDNHAYKEDTEDDSNDDTDDGGRGHLYTIKVPGCCSWVPGPWSSVPGLRSLVLGLRSLVLCGLAQKTLWT